MRYSAFIQYTEQVSALLPLDPAYWIVEHPAFSLRSGVSAEAAADVGRIRSIAEQLPQPERLVVQIDLLMRDSLFQDLERFLDQLERMGIQNVRVQDAGLFYYLVKQRRFNLQLNPETGGCTTRFWRTFGDLAGQRLTLCHIPDQCTLNEAQVVSDDIEPAVEILADGPLLMYNSYRLALEQPEQILLTEEQRPGEQFLLDVDEQGSRLYYSRRRWLLPQISELPEDLILLLDFRQLPGKRLTSRVRAYAAAASMSVDSVDQHPRSVSRKPAAEEADGRMKQDILARVLHREPDRYLLLQADAEFSCPLDAQLISQDGRRVTLQLEHLKDPDENLLFRVSPETLFQIPVQAGIATGAVLSRQPGEYQRR